MFAIVKKEVTAEPVSIDEAKVYLKIQHSDEDALLCQLITSARDLFERYINKALSVKTLILECDGYDFDDDNIIELPYYPVKEIVSITEYTDSFETGAPVTSYKEKGKGRKSIYIPYIGESTFEIEYITGYDKCPEGIKTLLLKQVYEFYENRGDLTLSANIKRELQNYNTDGKI